MDRRNYRRGYVAGFLAMLLPVLFVLYIKLGPLEAA